MNRMLVLFLLSPLSLNAAFGNFGRVLKLVTTYHEVTKLSHRTLFSRRTLEENVVLCDLIIKDLNQQRISLSSIHSDPKRALKICFNVLAHYADPEFPLVTPLTWQPSLLCVEVAQALLIARQQRVMLRAHDLLQEEPQRSCECSRSAALAVLSGIRTFEEDEVTKTIARSYKKRLVTEDTLPECPFCG